MEKKVRFKDEVEATQIHKKVGSVLFKLLTNVEVVNLATLPINERTLYDREKHTIFENGPLDLRLGVSDKINTCQTCYKKLAECPGHWGFIKMAIPLFHIGYFKHVIDILKCICKRCAKFLLNSINKEKFSKRLKRKQIDSTQKTLIFKKIVEECRKITKCIYCGASNGVIKKMPGFPTKIVYVKKSQTNVEIDDNDDINIDADSAFTLMPNLEQAYNRRKIIEYTSIMVYELFTKIREEDVIFLKLDPELAHPLDLLITHLLAPPVCIRPTVQIGPGTTNEDDLTIKVAEMVQLNKLIDVSIKEGMEQHKLNEHIFLLQSTFTQYINSDTPGLPFHLLGSKSIRALCQRLKGKHGRFRGNLSGKRVDFSGRTVISPDPNIRIDQVIVPMHMAKILTYPQIVNVTNKAFLKQLVRNGPENYPGANYVEYPDNQKISLQVGNRKNIANELKIGDIVERHLIDGDIVLFNRQPSLHRLSIMAHRAKIQPWKTLRFNECVCTPYNADFDGDEMNIHVPQTEEARAEALHLMGVQENLITPKNGEPIISLTQDFLTCSFLMTQRDTFFDRAQTSQLCCCFNEGCEKIELPPPAIMKPVELWTGKQIFNVILRPNRLTKLVVHVSQKERNYIKDEFMCPRDGWILIHNSEFLSGNLGKGTLGAGSKGGLFFAIIRDNSRYAAAQCMNRIARMSSRWLSNYGVTIGVSDVTPSPDLIEQNKIMMNDAYIKCDKQIELYNQGRLELRPGCNDEQTLESNLNGILSKIRDEVGEICRKQLPLSNPALIMAVCGSKGSNINLCQMIACVGQQTANGQRMPEGFTNRTLPHFEQNSKQPAAKGFVQNSFFSGLSPPEFFFHTIGGREGLIDTAVKTAETGYMQRRLMKALEDLTVQYDYSVRTSNGTVVQFFYGEDGLDPMMMEDKDKPVNFNRLMKFVKGLKPFRKDKETSLFPYEIEAEYKILSRQCDAFNISLVSQSFFNDLDQYFLGLIHEIANQRERLGLQPFRTEQEYQEFIEQGSFNDENLQGIIDSINSVTTRQIKYFFQKMWEKYYKALIVPGDAVGAVTAQSIGEPGTQMTLKTFHFAGVASMNITLGVPRIKEIINAAKNIATPLITAKLLNEKDPITARIVKGRIEKTRLGDICEYIKEVYSPNGCFVEISLDQTTIESLKLNVNVHSVKRSIWKHSKLKIKENNIDFINEYQLRVEPSDYASDKIKLPDVVVSGIASVNRAVINQTEQKDGSIKYNLIVEGYGLRDVMCVPGIDPLHTKPNHIMEAESILGIEAARSSIANEIKYIMEMHGMSVDFRHIGMLADIMTFKGVILGITRFGISKMKDSTLMLASFERTTDILFDAAVSGQVNDINGVSECIIMGEGIPVGTGLFKLLYDAKPEKKKLERQKKEIEIGLTFEPIKRI